MAEEDPYSYDYKPEIDEKYNEFYETEAKQPLSEEYANVDQYYGKEEGKIVENEGEGILSKKKSKRWKGICGDKTLNLGFIQINVSDIPLPFVDPTFFHTVKKAGKPWMVWVSYIDLNCSLILGLLNVICFIYMVILYGVYKVKSDVWTYLGIFVAIVIFLCMCPVNFMGKYMTMYKTQTSQNTLVKSFLLVYFVFCFLSILAYIYFFIGIIGTTGVIQMFTLSEFTKDAGVIVFYIMNAVLMLGWLFLIISNSLILVTYTCKMCKACKSQPLEAETHPEEDVESI